MEIKDIYTPDSRWELYVKSKEEFVENYVLIGRFHKDVPSDIVSAFETVTHLLGHSYYHWPLQDEALSKSLLIIEMALKLKAKQLKISLDIEDNSGRTFQKKLVNLIKEICAVPHLSFLKDDFERARKLRNYSMHPDQHSYMGAIARPKSNAMLFANIINYLFLPKADLEQLLMNRKLLKKGMLNFKNNLFVLERGGKKNLFDSIHFHKYAFHLDKEILILLFNPILINASECIGSHKFPAPLIVCLKEFQINGGEIEGIDVYGQSISIYPTLKEENIRILETYDKEIRSVAKNDVHSYHTYLTSKALWAAEELIHSHCWSTNDGEL